jgi:hypothetical protein
MWIWNDGKKKLKSLHKCSAVQFKDSTKWRPSGLLLLMTIKKIQERRLMPAWFNISLSLPPAPCYNASNKVCDSVLFSLKKLDATQVCDSFL